MPQPTVTVVACFPPGFFLENIAAFKDGGLLVTVANQRQLYYIPPAIYRHQVAPLVLATFEPGQQTMGIQVAPQNHNVFYMLTSDMLGLGSHTCSLYVIDCSNPATGPMPQKIFTFPKEAKALNGLCSLSESRLIAADSFGSCIWAIDLDTSTFPPKNAAAKKWLAHDTMYGVLKLPDFQPGVNGLKYHARTSHAYYTNTQKRLFCRVSVDRKTLEPTGEPEILAEGMPGDDLIIDDTSVDGPVAYVTTHRDNSILKIHLTNRPGLEKVETTLEGSMELQDVLGPTAGVWAPGLEGKSAFFTSDGGLKNALENGVVRCAKIIKKAAEDTKSFECYKFNAANGRLLSESATSSAQQQTPIFPKKRPIKAAPRSPTKKLQASHTMEEQGSSNREAFGYDYKRENSSDQ